MRNLCLDDKCYSSESPNNPGYRGKFMSSLESGQPSGEHQKPASRPPAVTVALILFIFNLCFDLVVGFAEGMHGDPVFPPGTDILFALFCLWPLFFGLFVIVVLYFPLWFICCQRNWARWYAVFLTCLLAVIVSRMQASFALAATLLINMIATVALFLPSSNRWFRSRAKPPPPLPT
jgi:hypothetical protein